MLVNGAENGVVFNKYGFGCQKNILLEGRDYTFKRKENEAANPM